ncbi:MAG: Gfo/Idh/MocA family oxidoreductase [Planctomycetota bacterium]
MAKKIRVGLIGCGSISGAHAAAYKQWRDMADVIATCDMDKAKAQARADALGARQVCTQVENLLANPDIDAVDICLPHDLHAPVVLAAAKAGKAILCEKPISTNLADARKMVSAARGAGVPFMVAHSDRFSPTSLKMKELIDSGAIGKVFLARASFEYYPAISHRAWMGDKKKVGGGGLNNSGIHFFDTMRYFLGDIQTVAAVQNLTRDDMQGEDTSIVIMIFRCGAVGEIMNSLAIQGVKGARSSMSIHGSKGTIVGERDKVELRLPGAPEPVVETYECSGPPGITEEIRQFLDALRIGKNVPVTGEDGYVALEVCMAAYESAAKGVVVKL